MPAYPALSLEGLSTSLAHFYLEDTGEVGDEYLHRKPANDTTCVFDTHRVTGRNYQANAVRETEMDEADWPLPKAATPDRQGRAAEKVACPTKTWATKWLGVDRIEYRVAFDNHARDHRIVTRIESVQLDDVQQFIFEGQFDAVERPLEDPLQAEGALPLRPQQFWTAISGNVDGRDGAELWTLTLINRGLPEIDQTPQKNWSPHITLTLLRCVGQLSARGDGPGISTPDAQCPGKHTFEYAVSMTKGDWKQGQVWKQAHQFNVPLIAVQCPPDGARPAARSFVTVEPAELVVTAIKRAEDRDTLVLRFFNITDEPVPEGRIGLPGAKRLRLVNLNEEPQEEWREGDRLDLEVGAKKIVTVEFEL
jgi:mannosylglycerate hydrolase